MSPKAASRLSFLSNWKLNSEAAYEEPRLRRMLGHLSVFEQSRAYSQPKTSASPSLEDASEPNELSTYLQQHVPSFREFQAAIQEQLATIAEAQANVARLKGKEYHIDEEELEEDDSESDSYDDDWTDDDNAAESDDSLTDCDSSDGRWSGCSSPTSCDGEDEPEDEQGLWAIRPSTTLPGQRSTHS